MATTSDADRSVPGQSQGDGRNRAAAKWAIAGLFLAMFLATQLGPVDAVLAANDTIPDPVQIYLPSIQSATAPTPSPSPTPSPTYDSLRVVGPPVDRPPAINGDLNLALRGYVEVDRPLTLVDVNGPTDNDAPQLAGLFDHRRGPDIVSAHQVRDWDWECDENGCASDPIATPPVTLLGLRATPGEPVYIPSRVQEIHGGEYKALVLYAEAERITLTYTREDTPAIGYIVHIEAIAVEPALISLYEQLDAEGRERLPALRNGERLGDAAGDVLKVAIRDTGSFMDPRSRKDWWRGW